eukprot:gene1831-2003_t
MGSVVDRIDVVEVLLDHALDWCEAGHRVRVILDVFLEAQIDYSALAHELSIQRYCTANQLDISITSHKQWESDQELSVYHRQHFMHYLSSYDLFVFSEDDVAIRLATIKKWLEESSKWKEVEEQVIVGLLRYENAWVRRRASSTTTTTSNTLLNEVKWFDRNVPMNRVIWDVSLRHLMTVNHTNTPILLDTNPTIILNNQYLRFKPDQLAVPYAASAIYSKRQLESLEKDCHFLSRQEIMENYHRGRPFYASTQPFLCSPQHIRYKVKTESEMHLNDWKTVKVDTPECHCCKLWIFPVHHFESLLVHHIGSPGDNNKMDNKWSNRHRLGHSTFVKQWRDQALSLTSLS